MRPKQVKDMGAHRYSCYLSQLRGELGVPGSYPWMGHFEDFDLVKHYSVIELYPGDLGPRKLTFKRL